MEIERGLAEKRKSREQVGEEELGASRAGARSSVVDFDFLFEFSPERPRAEADLRFEQVLVFVFVCKTDRRTFAGKD